MKQYRLLRNNKESGPFTFEELIKMGLKPYDLLWLEGKSAGWRYPSEINELIPYAPMVEEQPYDRFYKRPAAAPTAKAVVEPAIPAEKKQKPRIKITAVSQKIETSVPLEEKKNEEVAGVAPHWKDIYQHWENDKKEKDEPKQGDAGQRTEWVENFPNRFSDIMEPEAEKILIQKDKKGAKTKNGGALVFLLGLMIISMAIWIAYSWSKTSSHNPDEVNIATVENNPSPVLNKAESVAGTETSASKQEETQKDEIKPSLVKHNDDNAAGSEIVSHAASPVIAKNKAAVKKEAEIKKPPVTPSPAVKKATTPAISQQTQTADQTISEKGEHPVFKKEKASPKIKDYIQVSSIQPVENSATGVKYKIENVSEIPVDLIMLDLMYYDVNGKYKKGETVYVRNVAPGQTVSLPAPDNADAAKIKYRISMISAESQGLYLIAD